MNSDRVCFFCFLGKAQKYCILNLQLSDAGCEVMSWRREGASWLWRIPLYGGRCMRWFRCHFQLQSAEMPLYSTCRTNRNEIAQFQSFYRDRTGKCFSQSNICSKLSNWSQHMQRNVPNDNRRTFIPHLTRVWHLFIHRIHPLLRVVDFEMAPEGRHAWPGMLVDRRSEQAA